LNIDRQSYRFQILSTSPAVSDFRGQQRAIEDFIRVVVENGTPRCDGVEARRSIALIEEIYTRATSSVAP